MSEYIVDTFGIVQDFADLHGDMNTPLYQAIMDVMLSRQREEIVRCRDCKHYMDYEHEYEPNLGYCREHDREEVHSMRFCAWGERRES